MNSLIEAVKTFRDRLGESQQAFAARLGLSIRAIANYEKDRQPTGKSLIALHRAARKAGQKDLADLFWNAAHDELGLNSVAARQVNDVSVEVSLAIALLRSIDPANPKPNDAGRLKNAISKLEVAARTLDAMDPYSLGEES